MLKSSFDDDLTFDYNEDPDDVSIAASESTIVTQASTSTSVSSLTQWGPGTLSGRGIMAVGEAMLNSIENIVLHRRLRTISKFFPHRDDTLIPDNIYNDLVELSRVSIYNHTTRGIALAIIVVQIATEQTSQLVRTIERWPSKEIRLLISELMLSLYPSFIRSARKSEKMHHILRELYCAHRPKDYRTPGPFEIFANQIAEYSPESTPSHSVLALTTLCAGLPTRTTHSLKICTKRVHSVLFFPDSTQFISASDDGAIRIWDISTHKTAGGQLSMDDALVTSMALSPDGNYIAASYSRRDRLYQTTWICIWSLQDRKPVCQSTRTDSWIYTLAYSPDGGRVASGSADGTVRLWNVNTGPVMGKPIKWHDGAVYSVAFSPDGRHIASGSNDKTIFLCDTVDGLLIGRPFRDHEYAVWSIAYSVNGKYMASSSFNTLRIWDLEATRGKSSPFAAACRCIAGHSSAITCIAFSSDSRFLISGGSDGTVRIWEVDSGEAVIALRTFEGSLNAKAAVCALSISPSTDYMVAGTEGGMLYSWRRE